MRPVVAYLDPVTGAAITQVLLGVVAATSVGYHLMRRRVVEMVQRFRSTRTSHKS